MSFKKKMAAVQNPALIDVFRAFFTGKQLHRLC